MFLFWFACGRWDPRPLLTPPTHRSTPLRRQEVVNSYLQQYLPDAGLEMGWTGNLVACAAGNISEDYAAAAIRRVNFYRSMAGLPDTVRLDTQLSPWCQAALMMATQGALSYNPAPEWRCYTTGGAEAARHSNPHLGLAGPEAIDSYMDDPLLGYYYVGHRRWILYPPQEVMGTGSVPREGQNRLLQVSI